MKRLLIFIFLSFYSFALSQDSTSSIQSFYAKSLHYTNKGLTYFYQKEQGGLERLTGVPASKLGCEKSQCHATSCDICHAKTTSGKQEFSKSNARNPENCYGCHGEPEKNSPDVHQIKGMVCMDCHTAREIHGDGIAHNSYKEPGFFDVKCKNCHTNLSQSESHKIHAEKLDCAVCHTIETETCVNCHIDSRLKAQKVKQIKLSGMYFLVNHDGKVKLANLLSYVYGNKTMLTFAPTFYHSIKKEGKTCNQCHNSKNVNDIGDGNFKLTWWENNGLKNSSGVIPVLEGFKWNLVYLDWVDSNWVPLQNPEEPVISYSGYCTPLTKEQFRKLNIPIHER